MNRKTIFELMKIMSEPVCTALLFADRIIIENNGKKGIIGTFSKLFAQSFPVASAPWGIFASITNIQGKHDFSLSLENIDSNQIILPITGELESHSAEDMVELVFNTNAVVFPTQGKYSLTLKIDNEVLSSIVLHVEQVKQ